MLSSKLAKARERFRVLLAILSEHGENHRREHDLDLSGFVESVGREEKRSGSFDREERSEEARQR